MLKDKLFVEFKLSMPYNLTQDGEWWVSECRALNVVSQGHSREEAMKNLSEATSLFLINCFDRGVLDKVLKQAGFRSVGLSAPAILAEPNTQYMDVQLPLALTGPQQLCHA